MKRPLAFLILIMVIGAAHAEAFRCGTKLITEGDTISEVAAKCGAATQVDHSTIVRSSTVYGRGQLGSASASIEVAIETWLYNLGPDKFMRRIHFEDGRVVAIESLGYGYIDNSH